MSRSWLRDLSIAVLAAVGVILALELVARVLEPDDRRARAQRMDPLPPKPPGTFRLFAFGSSSVYGHPVPELGFVAQLAYWLEREAPEGIRVEVHNLAIPGVPSQVVLDTVERAMAWEPDLVLIHTGWAEFVRDEGETAQVTIRRSLQRNSALLRFARRLASGRQDAARDLYLPILQHPIDRQGAEYRERLARYERNLGRIVDAATAPGVPLLLATLSVNLADWEPMNRLVAPHLYDQTGIPPFGDIQDLMRIGAHKEAAGLCRDALERFPDDALLLFLLGRALAESGQPDPARDAFERAHTLDPIPWRPPAEVQELIRAAAAERSGVTLVDVRERLEARSPNRLLGREMVLDNAHPSLRGGSAIARQVLETMAGLGILLDPGAGVFAVRDPVAPFLEHAQREAAPRDLIVETLKSSARYCMVGPYQQYDAARRYLRQWNRRSPKDWRPWANMASVSFLTGEVQRGRQELQRAVTLRGGAAGIARVSEAPHLERSMKAAGVELAEFGG